MRVSPNCNSTRNAPPNRGQDQLRRGETVGPDARLAGRRRGGARPWRLRCAPGGLAHPRLGHARLGEMRRGRDDADDGRDRKPDDQRYSPRRRRRPGR